MFWNTSIAIKRHSPSILFGGLSDSPAQAEILVSMQQDREDRKFDFFTYHSYCNGQPTATDCGRLQASTVAGLRTVLPVGMPIYLEETGSTAGCYNQYHDSSKEAAFVIPYVASMQGAGLAGAHWWCASDIYTEHGCPPAGKNYTWIPHEDYSGGMPRSEFTGRWGFTTPSGVAKPIHRAFQLLHAAGDARIGAAEAAGGSCGDTTVLALANSTARGGAMIFVANSGRGACNVTLAALPTRHIGGDPVTRALLHRIDSTNANPLVIWEGFGAPPFPSLTQIAALKAASELNATPVILLAEGSSFKLQVPSEGLAVLVL
jgi:hypothetical protein